MNMTVPAHPTPLPDDSSVLNHHHFDRLVHVCVKEHQSCEVAVMRRDASGLLWPLSFLTVPEDLEGEAEEPPEEEP